MDHGVWTEDVWYVQAVRTEIREHQNLQFTDSSVEGVDSVLRNDGCFSARNKKGGTALFLNTAPRAALESIAKNVSWVEGTCFASPDYRIQMLSPLLGAGTFALISTNTKCTFEEIGERFRQVFQEQRSWRRVKKRVFFVHGEGEPTLSDCLFNVDFFRASLTPRKWMPPDEEQMKDQNCHTKTVMVRSSQKLPQSLELQFRGCEMWRSNRTMKNCAIVPDLERIAVNKADAHSLVDHQITLVDVSHDDPSGMQ